MKCIQRKMTVEHKKGKNAAANSDRQAYNINKRSELVSNKISESKFDVTINQCDYLSAL